MEKGEWRAEPTFKAAGSDLRKNEPLCRLLFGGDRTPGGTTSAGKLGHIERACCRLGALASA